MDSCPSIKCVSINNTEFEEESWQLFCAWLAPNLEHLSSGVAVAVRQRGDQVKWLDPFKRCYGVEEWRITLFTLATRINDDWTNIDLSGVAEMSLVLVYIKMLRLGPSTYGHCSQVHQIMCRLIENISRYVRFFRLEYPDTNVFQVQFYLPVLSLITRLSSLKSLNLNLSAMIRGVRKTTYRQQYYDKHIDLLRQLDKLESLTIKYGRGVNAIDILREIARSFDLAERLNGITRLGLIHAKINCEFLTLLNEHLPNIQLLRLVECRFKDKDELDNVVGQICLMASLEELNIENCYNKTVTINTVQVVKLMNDCKNLKSIRIVNESLSEEDGIRLAHLAKVKEINFINEIRF